MKVLFCLLLACAPLLASGAAPGSNDPILGRWITDRKDLIVEVYQYGEEYKAKIVWVSDPDPDRRLDEKNPVPALRSRKVVGMDVLRGLTHNEQEDCWENGHIYDATSGKTWSATVRLAGEETLVVRGYCGFELFGKTIKFRRHK